VGSVFVLGATVEEATERIQEKLGALLRYPQATLSVTNFGERRVFVSGEVRIPGGYRHLKGMTLLSAIAQAVGFSDAAKRSSVIVLRREGEERAIAYRVDVTDPLKGEHLERDLILRPYDIVYVPKTFIASVQVLLAQYFGGMMAPFSLYLEGWWAFNIDEKRVQVVSR